ncbi:MAG: GYD domain-containing protein [Actinomycetes bacterium]
MPMYLTAFSQTAETWAKLIASPDDRRASLGPVVESMGGKLHGYWYAFGETDGYALIEAPDDVTAASLLVKVASTGAMTKLATTKLIAVEDAMDALGRAGSLTYRPPGAGG